GRAVPLELGGWDLPLLHLLAAVDGDAFLGPDPGSADRRPGARLRGARLPPEAHRARCVLALLRGVQPEPARSGALSSPEVTRGFRCAAGHFARTCRPRIASGTFAFHSGGRVAWAPSLASSSTPIIGSWSARSCRAIRSRATRGPPTASRSASCTPRTTPSWSSPKSSHTFATRRGPA